jgi:hypothetical protein
VTSDQTDPTMSSKIHIVRVLAVVMTLSVVCGRHPTLTKADERPGIAAAGEFELTTDLPKHFILNPDYGRPAEYPAEISLKQLETFLKTQRMVGQGCGGMTWEGAACGMFSNIYEATKTPWLKDPLALDASYAQTKTGNFLASFMLGRNRYERADRNSDKLTWKQNYEPEYERQAVYEVLYGKYPAKRKELLTRISDSLQSLDVSLFPAKRRELLIDGLEQCQNDSDPAVTALARQLIKTLGLRGTQP